jgi:hypothetical protein
MPWKDGMGEINHLGRRTQFDRQRGQLGYSGISLDSPLRHRDKRNTGGATFFSRGIEVL